MSKVLDYGKILDSERYYTISDLRYSDKVGLKFSAVEIQKFFDFKDALAEQSDESAVRLNLKAFDSRYIFYLNHFELRSLYKEYRELIGTEGIFFGAAAGDTAKRYSELEGSIKIEGYKSTKRIFDEISSGRKPENTDEFVIRNMAECFEFIEGRPEFNEENLFEMYRIMSADCLAPDQQLRTGEKYRYDAVYISNDSGAPCGAIKACMDSLFEFVRKGLKSESPFIRFMLPHIVHYYIVYVHPYFDCNGRMARMCSLWVAKLSGGSEYPYYISEAINAYKKDYYKAIAEVRESNNDLTYFLIFLLRISLEYGLVLRTMNEYKDDLAEAGDRLTDTELEYLRRIIVHSNGNRFGWKDFTEFVNSDMSKQGALKTLNKLERYGVLNSKTNRKKEKVFALNKKN